MKTPIEVSVGSTGLPLICLNILLPYSLEQLLRVLRATYDLPHIPASPLMATVNVCLFNVRSILPLMLGCKESTPVFQLFPFFAW